MKIANIVYHEDLVNHEKVDYVNYIQYHIEDGKLSNTSQIDYNLPTLYVGWEFLKKLQEEKRVIFYNNTKPSILEKELDKNKVYWEFSFKEKKSDHVNGVQMFVNDSPYYYFRGYKFINCDPFFNKIETVEDVLAILPDQHKTVYSYKKEMLYVFDGDQTIYGVDLRVYAYMGYDVTQLENAICSNTKDCIIDEDGEIHKKYYKIYPFFENLKRYLSVLLTKP
jgi:hypothetical protein